MWATLALAAALQTVPAQPGAFALKNVRASHGLLGQTRKEAKYSAAICRRELRLAEPSRCRDGTSSTASPLDVSTKARKSVFKLEPQEFKAELSLFARLSEQTVRGADVLEGEGPRLGRTVWSAAARQGLPTC